MTTVWQVAIPEAWRVELMRSPERAGRWREAGRTARVPFSLLDWEDRLGERLIVAALDLSTAELLLKLPSGVRAIALDHRVEPVRRLGRGAERLLGRARDATTYWVAPTHHPRGLPVDLVAFLDPALDRAEDLR